MGNQLGLFAEAVRYSTLGPFGLVAVSSNSSFSQVRFSNTYQKNHNAVSCDICSKINYTRLDIDVEHQVYGYGKAFGTISSRPRST